MEGWAPLQNGSSGELTRLQRPDLMHDCHPSGSCRPCWVSADLRFGKRLRFWWPRENFAHGRAAGASGLRYLQLPLNLRMRTHGTMKKFHRSWSEDLSTIGDFPTPISNRGSILPSRREADYQEEIEQLETNMRTFKSQTRAMDLEARAKTDFDFHQLIVEFSEFNFFSTCIWLFVACSYRPCRSTARNFVQRGSPLPSTRI